MKLITGQTICAMAVLAAPFATHADCTTDGPINASILSAKLVCAYKPGSGGSDPNRRWSEIHNAAADGGSAVTLGEHGRGTTDTAGTYDADIGTWGYSTSSVTYTYTGDGTYNLTLRGTDASTPTSLCDGSTESAVIHAVSSIPAPTATNPCGW